MFKVNLINLYLFFLKPLTLHGFFDSNSLPHEIHKFTFAHVAEEFRFTSFSLTRLGF